MSDTLTIITPPPPALTLVLVQGPAGASGNGGTNGSGSTLSVTLASHGFAVLDWLSCVGGVWQRALADDTAIRADGVVSAIADEDHFTVALGGAVSIPSHGYNLGPLYLSQSAPGEATSVEPISGTVQQVANVIAADEILVLQLSAVER